MASTDSLRARRGAVAVLVAAFALGACGEGNDSTDEADVGTAETTVSVPTTEPVPFTLTSSDFEDGATIPTAHVCTAQGGANEQPSLAWVGLPEGTTSLALVMDDPDAPVEGGFVHWVLVDLDPAAGGVEPGVADGVVGPNGAGVAEYLGPCPPPGDPHTYVFTLYAYEEAPDWSEAPTRDEVVASADDALATAVLEGTFGNAG